MQQLSHCTLKELASDASRISTLLYENNTAITESLIHVADIIQSFKRRSGEETLILVSRDRSTIQTLRPPHTRREELLTHRACTAWCLNTLSRCFVSKLTKCEEYAAIIELFGEMATAVTATEGVPTSRAVVLAVVHIIP